MRSVRESPKRPINLSLNAKVLEMAREMGINISQTVDELLAAEVLRLQAQRWQEQNREAIEQYNARIEREGSFAQRIQRFLSPQEEPAAGKR